MINKILIYYYLWKYRHCKLQLIDFLLKNIRLDIPNYSILTLFKNFKSSIQQKKG